MSPAVFHGSDILKSAYVENLQSYSCFDQTVKRVTFCMISNDLLGLKVYDVNDFQLHPLI